MFICILVHRFLVIVQVDWLVIGSSSLWTSFITNFLLMTFIVFLLQFLVFSLITYNAEVICLFVVWILLMYWRIILKIVNVIVVIVLSITLIERFVQYVCLFGYFVMMTIVIICS